MASTPTIVGISSAVVNGTGPISPTLPAGIAVGDISFAVFETANQAITMSGWTAPHAAQGQGTAAAIGGVMCTVLAREYQSGDTTPTSSDSGNHQIARIITVRGVDLASPYADTDGGNNAASNVQSMNGLTSDVANCLALYFTADDRDIASSGTQWRDAEWAATGVTGGFMTEAFDDFTSDGVGGGIACAYGEVLTATTLTGVSGRHSGTNSFATSWIGLMLRPASSAATCEPDDAAHVHSADAVTITAHAVSSPAAASHVHAAGSPTLTAHAVASPANAASVHTAGEPAVSAPAIASPASSAHALVSGEPSLAAHAVAAPASASHVLSSGDPTPIAHAVATPASAASVHTATSPDVGSPEGVQPESVHHALTNSEPVMVAHAIAAPASTAHASASGAPVVISRSAVSPDSSSHAHAAASAIATPHAATAPGGAAHTLVSSAPIIVSRSIASPASCVSLHTATSPSAGVPIVGVDPERLRSSIRGSRIRANDPAPRTGVSVRSARIR